MKTADGTTIQVVPETTPAENFEVALETVRHAYVRLTNECADSVVQSQQLTEQRDRVEAQLRALVKDLQQRVPDPAGWLDVDDDTVYVLRLKVANRIAAILKGP